MGYIKEPDGIDFVINGKPLTKKQKQAISEFINADKERLAKSKNRRKKSTTRQQESKSGI
ncbi:MAG: hypothetical protein ABIO05_00275 [Ferruginibacter sp.]